MKSIPILVLGLFVGACGAQPVAEQGAETTEAAPQMRVVPVTSQAPTAVAAFEHGRFLNENIRPAEAAKQFEKALELDPGFPQARAALGQVTPGNEGLEMLRQAAISASELPETERLWIEALWAQRAGEEEKWRGLLRKVAELAPDDWRPQIALGTMEFVDQNWEAALVPLKRATELNPKAGNGWNLLGYTHASMEDWDPAIAALEKYVEVEPDEPNPRDSLGEVRMMAGRLEEAEEAFVAATQVDAGFWQAWVGVAQSRFLRGDWDGGRQALEKASAAAPRPQDKLAVADQLWWSLVAEGDGAKATEVLDQHDVDAREAGLDQHYVFSSTQRAFAHIVAGEYEEALAQTEEALERGKSTGLEGAALLALRRNVEQSAQLAEAKLGRLEAAEARIAFLEAESEKAPAMVTAVHVAKGVLAMAKGENAAAVETLSKCDPRAALCAWQLAEAQEQAGEAEAAAATSERLRSLRLRGGFYLTLWAKAGGAEVQAEPHAVVEE